LTSCSTHALLQIPIQAAGATGADTSSVPSDSTIDQRGFEELANSHLSVPSVSARLPQGGKLKTQ